MEGKAIFLLGVVWLAGVSTGYAGDAGGTSDVNAPMADQREKATPEVVLQLKYEQGALNRIYLTQFRPETQAATVPAQTQLCADLCHAGLGGDPCGGSCTDMVPVGLATALRSNRSTTHTAGAPRVDVCPTLCHYHLGKPLCSCPERKGEAAPAVEWGAVCDAFCLNDGYLLGGCPVCKKVSVPPVPLASTFLASRQLDTVEGWVTWCNVQCRQGHGGAACNCDRAPF